MRIRQARKILEYSFYERGSKISSYYKALYRVRKYQRKLPPLIVQGRPLLPKLREKTFYIKEKPNKDMFDDLRECYDEPSKPYKDISTEFFGFLAMSGTFMDPLNE